MPPHLPTLLMTRPRAASEQFVADLRTAGIKGFRLVVSPLIKIRITGPLPDMGADDAVIFTSANGVAAYAKLAGQTPRLAYCVGARTAKAAHEAGLVARSADGDVDALLALLLADPPQAPLWHLRGDHARGHLASRLAAKGIPCGECVVYEQPACAFNSAARVALHGPGAVIAPLFSPRSAQLFSARISGNAPLFVAAMSPAVAEAVDVPYLSDIRIAARPTAGHLLDVVAKLLEHAAMLEAGRDAQ